MELRGLGGALLMGATVAALASSCYQDVKRDAFEEGRAVTAESQEATYASEALIDTLPYWGVRAPEWCLEDMMCWIGSAADGRDSITIMSMLESDLINSSDNYDGQPTWTEEQVAAL
ncbi:MAG: hypothetical protein ACRCSN_04795 [Dermatophilaceae bacterium]